jgi:hypothetical protein
MVTLFFVVDAAASWPISSTKQTYIVIRDSFSGEPIPGAIVSVHWQKNAFTVMEPRIINFRTKYVMSDVNGQARIPAYSSLHIFSSYGGQLISIRHPSYETVFFHIRNGGIDNPGSVLKRVDVHKYEIKMLRLDRKYLRIECAIEKKDSFLFDTCAGTKNDFHLDIRRASQYFVGLDIKKILQFNIELIPNCEEVLREWFEIGNKIYEKSPYEPFFKKNSVQKLKASFKEKESGYFE